MSAPIDLVLSRLQRVKRTGPGKWIAACPTREDRSPSLAIRELDDGTLLLHDFGGEGVEAVLGAIGLTVADLFPERAQEPGAGRKPERRPWNAGDLIALAAWESSVACVICSDIFSGKDGADFDRLLVAASRLANVAEAVHAR